VKLSDLDIKHFGNGIQMSGVVYSGQDGDHYLVPFPEYVDDLDEADLKTLEMTHIDWKDLLRQTDIMEAEVLAKTENGEVYKAIVRKSERQIGQQVSWNVYRRDGFKCRYCGKDDVPLTVDHAILWEEGGPSVEANLVSCCRKCNKIRGNTQYADWLQHRYYLEVYKNLTPDARYQNEMLVGRLDSIPRLMSVRSR